MKWLFRYTDCVPYLIKKDRFRESISKMKNGKDAGQVGVVSEMVKATGEA